MITIEISHIIEITKQSFVPILYVALLSFFFAKVEIQIEGAAGWAANLPTWRIEKHWLLDLFWGGRAMTGYHAWLFPFIFLVFHFNCLLTSDWSWKLETRILGALLLFWVLEDWLWFVCNPAFGMSRFTSVMIPWHKHWVLGMPVDYIVMGLPGLGMIFYSVS